MKTKSLLFFLTLLFCATLSKAQLYFKNNTEEPVHVCIGMFYDGSNSKHWGTEGWYKVDPGDKVKVSEAIGFNDNIYYYAKSTTSNKEYAGDVSMLVHPTNKFFIKNADKDYVKKENPEYVYKKFRHVDMKSGLLQLKYTIELKY